MNDRVKAITGPIIAIALAVVIGGIVAAAIGYNPLSVYGSLLSGAFGNLDNLASTLSRTVPLILIGLGISIAFRAGLFNIGAEGQYWIGVMVAAWFGYHFTTLPGWLHIILCIIAAMVAGGLWGGIIPGLAKAYRGAHEVITTMMMSYIGIFLAKYMMEDGPMREHGYTPQSPEVTKSVQLSTLIPNTQLTTWALIIALVATVVVWWLLFHTTFGFQLRAVGSNQRAARYAGMRVHLYTVLALGFSGVFAGLAGGVQLLAVNHRLTEGFSTNYGFTAIVVSLLARNNPFGVIIASLFFAGLSTGGQNMQIVSGVPVSLTDVLTGLIVFFVAAERLVPQVIHWYRKRRTGKMSVQISGEEGNPA
jgi:general nucleoside transport system permease protein